MVMVDAELDSGLRAGADKSILGFCKMQALGNDFIVVSEDDLNRALSGANLVSKNSFPQSIENDLLPQLARKICSRQFGIGADGFIVVRRSSKPERLAWSYLNSDGSISLMCGNGLRCLALWAQQNNFAPSKSYFVETGKGPVEIVFENANSITSDLGQPILEPAQIPVSEQSTQAIVARIFQLGNTEISITCISMGNPHCVIFVDGLADTDNLEKIAGHLQLHQYFPQGVNVEFVQVVSKTEVNVIVYERGCGRTLACASGAAAVVVAAALEHRCARNVQVNLEGGSLNINWSEADNHVRIKGPASIVFTGSIDLNSLGLEAGKC